MSFEERIEFTKDNIDDYLKEVAKEYRKRAGKSVPAELILIGGASVLINYGFRNMTTDVDAMIHASSVMKEAVNAVGDRYNLPNGWLNADFIKTDSYTAKLSQFSEHYRTFSNIVTVRTVSAEYLIAMKLRSGRQYKCDLSDVLGILAEHEKANNPIMMTQIEKAVEDLYDSWDVLPETSQSFINVVMADGRFEYLYDQVVRGEKEARELLIKFEQEYPGVTNTSNVRNILDNLQESASRDSLLSMIRESIIDEDQEIDF